MKPAADTSAFKVTGLFASALLALFVLHQDFWFRDSTHLVAGLPIGLAYHLGYCVLVSLVLGLFVFGRRR